MKKLFFIAAAALMLAAACTKTEVNAPDNRIGFMPVNQLTTKVTGSVFPTSEVFGTYAWTKGTAGEFFIDNKIVSYQNPYWTTSTPYYWPKNQTVDFFSYYPHNTSGVPAVSKTQISYTDIDYTANQVDYMYADKAVAFTDNANDVDDGVNAFTGVPTIFRHAGSKVKVNIILGENEKTEVDGTVTKWEVTLKSVALSGIYIKGTCVLNLSDAEAKGIVPWSKPQDSEGYYVWTADTNLTNDTDNALYKNVQHYDLVRNEGVPVIPEVYMLPQTLASGQQMIHLLFDVKTYRKAPGETDFNLTLTQSDITASADLLIDTHDLNEIRAWQMNQSIVYNITLGPAGKQITFDPAIDQWENKTVSTNIDLVI